MGQENGFDIEHLRELYEKELNAENMSFEEEVKKESGDQGRFGEKKANLASENTSSIVDQGSFGQKPQPDEETSWTCPVCETVNTGSFCSVCGGKRPETENEKLEREQREAEEHARQAQELREKEEHEEIEQKENDKNRRNRRKKTLINGIVAIVIMTIGVLLYKVIREGSVVPAATESVLEDSSYTYSDDSMLTADWNNATKYITVDGVDHAVFLDNRGRTVRLLLRSLSTGQLCADYRFEWTNDQICSISWLDTTGNVVVRHEFSYEDDQLKSDTIITNLDVWSGDYDWVAEEDDPAGYGIVSDGRGVTVVTWPDTGKLRFFDVMDSERRGDSIKFTAEDAMGQTQYSDHFTFWIVDDNRSGSQLLTISFTEDGHLSDYPFMTGTQPDTKYFDRDWNEI